MKRYPGQVWFLPPETEPGGDDKRRRHLLLTSCDDEGAGVFAFASTQPTEARFGAAFLFVDPATSPDPETGFTRPTYIYTSRLIASAAEDLLELAGRLVDGLPRVRALLGNALGLGTGTTDGSGEAAYSWRGRVVRLSDRRSESIGLGYGIVLTEAHYSNCRRYQIIVPMDDAQAFQPEASDLVVTHRAWFHHVDEKLTTALIAVADIQSSSIRSTSKGGPGP